MISALLARILTPLLLALAGLLAVVTITQTVRLGHAQHALDSLQQSITHAAQASELRAAQAGQEAVSSYVQAQQQDAPIVERVVTRVRNVCLRQPAAGGLPVPAVPGGDQQAAAAAQDDADRAAYLGVVADDLRTCAAALNICAAQYDFHQANVGATP